MKLEIRPLVALCDEKVNICISELPPSGKVKISASMSFPWAKIIKYESFALFTVDSSGNLDLSKQKPDSGTYDFIDSMGLIVSMRRVVGDLKDVIQNITVNESFFIDIAVECGQEKAYAKLERLLKYPEVKSLNVTDEFVGELFYTENRDYKIIVFLGGSGSNLDVNRPIAAVLASHGFNVLSLPYFNEKGLPADYRKFHLNILKKHSRGYRKIR